LRTAHCSELPQMKWIRRGLIAVVLWRLFGPVVSARFSGPQEHPWRVPARTLFVGERELSVREAGPTGAPVIVLIHGLAGSSLAEWYKVAPILAKRFRLVMVDHRSHGLSPWERGRFEITDEADDVAAVIDALGIDPVGIVGYSMGGTIALSLARRHPQVVHRLALVATMAYHPRAWRIGRLIGALVTRGWERLTGTGTPEVRAGYLLAVGAVERKHARWLWEETHRRDPDAGAAATFALLRFDARRWLNGLDVPSLVVIPTRDQLVPVKWQYDLVVRLPNAKVVQIEGARHELPWSHPDRLSAVLIEFFDPDWSDRFVREIAPGEKAEANHREH
jgi:pimeloyl-ACP methyl ester carboxylesterase